MPALPDIHNRDYSLPAKLGSPGGDLPNPPNLDILTTRVADDYIALNANSKVHNARVLCVTNPSNFHDRIVREAVRGEDSLCKRRELNRGDSSRHDE